MKAKLLVVDDEIGIHKVMASTLRPLGFDVIGSARAEEAISLIGLSHFDTESQLAAPFVVSLPRYQYLC
jgi:DNA-binding NtrC family response regulator